MAVSRPLVIAHRGASEAVAEHTRGAYLRAFEQGADGFECDVRLTADDELVCLHDRTLERTGGARSGSCDGGGTGVVSTMTLAELRDVDWGAWKHGAAGPGRDIDSGRLMTLRDLVELALGAGRPLRLLIETKHPTRAGGRVEQEVSALLAAYGMTGPAPSTLGSGQVTAQVMSFSALAIRRMSLHLPELPLAYLMTKPIPPPYRGSALPSGARAAALDITLVRDRPELVAAHHDAGHEVYVWTVDDDDDVARCLDAGVEAIITNRPGHVLDLVGARG